MITSLTEEREKLAEEAKMMGQKTNKSARIEANSLEIAIF